MQLFNLNNYLENHSFSSKELNLKHQQKHIPITKMEQEQTEIL
jgi:hypothetical protein